MMPHKPSGGEVYWRRFSDEEALGVPIKVLAEKHGYTIIWKSKTLHTPFVGPPRKLKRLVDDLQRWIDGR